MSVVRRIRKRNASIIVEAHAEILFMEGQPVHRWTNRFTGRLRAFTIDEAPTNKRPHWSHYGKPLKSTIVSARPRFWGNGVDKQRVYAAVGSTAPHASYVDQGTGVYAGGGAYEAKVLPPWAPGHPSLYEHTWRPPMGGTRGQDIPAQWRRKVAPVMIRGQRPQFFFEKGLARAFASMRMRSYQVPGDPSISEAMGSFPESMTNFVGSSGNTSANPAFIADLRKWREWRDESFNMGRVVGHDFRSSGETRRRAADRRTRAEASAARLRVRRENNKFRRAQASKKRSQERRDKMKAMKDTTSAKPRKPKVPVKQRAQVTSLRWMKEWQVKNPNRRILTSPQPWGFYYKDKTGAQVKQFWPVYIADMWAEAGYQHKA